MKYWNGYPNIQKCWIYKRMLEKRNKLGISIIPMMDIHYSTWFWDISVNWITDSFKSFSGYKKSVWISDIHNLISGHPINLYEFQISVIQIMDTHTLNNEYPSIFMNLIAKKNNKKNTHTPESNDNIFIKRIIDIYKSNYGFPKIIFDVHNFCDITV